LARREEGGEGTQFTCFISTKVRILTLKEYAGDWPAAKKAAKVLSLLALLVQKYEY
jgi:hypothetical protein